MGHSEARERARQSADAALRRPNLWFGPANILYRADRARALSWQRNINVQERSSRTAAADGRLLRKVIGSNEGTGAQRIDRSRAPSARTLAVDSRWPPPWGLPSKGTAAEDTQSCTRARTIRLLKIAVWKIQRDGGATRAPWREPKILPTALRHRCRGLPTEGDLRGESRHRHVSVQLCFCLVPFDGAKSRAART